MPTRGRFKVYLIDEVHMLSNHSFNALLKTLEEPPPHVKFLFATTDPQKLPVTVLSRCLQFNLKKLPLSLIQNQLDTICQAESIEAEPGALQAVARGANGSMRDALSLLDQAIAFGGGSVAEAQTKAMLGSIDRGHVTRLVELLADGEGGGLLDEIGTLDELAPDYGAVLEELMTVLQRVAVAQLVGGERLDDDDERLRALASRMTPEDVQLYFQIAVNGRRDVSVARDERISFEMTLLRMLAFTLESGVEDATGQRNGRPSKTAGAARASTIGSTPGAMSGAASRPAAPGATGPASVPSAGPPSGPARQHGEEAAGPGRAAKATAGRQASNDAAPVIDLATAASDWPALLRAAGLRGPVKSLAEHCVVGGVDGSKLDLTLAEDKADFNTDRLRERLRTGLGAYLGSEIRLSITTGTPANNTPAQMREDGESQRLRAAREAIESDPTVRAVQDAFDAVLEPGSIQPAESNGKR